MLTKINDAFAVAAQIAHSLIAIAGSGAAGAAVVVGILGLFGVHVTDSQVIIDLGKVGGAAALLSKGIDSAHNAFTTTAQLKSGANSTTAPLG